MHERLIDANALQNKICAACAERIACIDIGNICFEVACIVNAPTIEPEVRHGQWMFHEQKNGYLWKCTECKGNFEQCFSFCPHCGAKMTGG